MFIFFDNDKTKIYYDEKLQLLNVKFNTPENFSEKECLYLFDQYIRALKKYTPTFIIIDGRNDLYSIPVEIQEKISKTVSPIHVKNGTLRIAILKSAEFIVALSYEMIADEAKAGKLQIAYFTNEEEALEWFKKDRRLKKQSIKNNIQ